MSTTLPAPVGAVVHRPRLSELFESATRRPVTLLTAPPGWGKTAALRSWSQQRPDGAMTWLSLATATAADVTARATALQDAAEPGVLVLDDLHHGDAPATAQAVTDLVTRAAGGLRLVLSTRDDRALPVPRWRLSDQVAQIGCAELAFTRAETEELLGAHQVVLSGPEIEALHHRTEGWPAGVRFAVLRADGPDPLAAEGQDVARYLRDEMFAAMPVPTRELLRRTSVLDRVCAELAAELTGPGDPGAGPGALAALAEAGGFVLALGGTPTWYRYHRQFREALRAQLRDEPGAVGVLHTRAATWLTAHGLPGDAIRHAFATGAPDGFAVQGHDPAELALSACHVYESAGARPAAVVGDDPDLAAAYVVDRLCQGDADAADSGLRTVRTGQSTMVAGGLALARDRRRGDLDAIAASATRLVADTDATDPTQARVRAMALAAQAAARLGTGDLVGAGDALAGAEAVSDAASCTRRATAGLAALLLAITGELRTAERRARDALAAPPCSGQPGDVHSEPALLALALVSHEWDRPAEARRFLDLAARAGALSTEPELAGWAALIDARLRAAHGDLAGALDALRAVETRAPLRWWFAAAEAELRVSRGDAGAARAALAPLPAEHPVIAVALARAMAHDGDPHAAARALPPWSDDGAWDGPGSIRLAAGLVEARVAHDLGERRRCTEVLERLLELAQPHGFRQPFRGEGVRDLLLEHLDSGTAHWSTVHDLVGQPPPRPAGDPRSPMGEGLTERELTVLRYLQSMLSNEEIAAKLFVSVNTVKTHIRHIYRKLDVSHRRDAVRRGREARLL